MKILSSLTHFHVVLNRYGFISSADYKERDFNFLFCLYNESQWGPVLFWIPVTFNVWTRIAETFFKIYFFVFCIRKKKKCKFGMTKGNDDSLIFAYTMPFNDITLNCKNNLSNKKVMILCPKAQWLMCMQVAGKYIFSNRIEAQFFISYPSFSYIK